VTGFSDPLPGLRCNGAVETIRLRAVQQPSRVERLLVSFASNSGIVAEGSYLVRNPKVMAPLLQRAIAEVESKGHAWCCWTDDSRVWLITGELSLALSRECGSPVLDVRVYHEDGAIADSDCWLVDQDGKWRRCAVTGGSDLSAR
jgi:hypothetical protein